MARLHFVKKARKANKDAGIKKGDSYYWWKFMSGGRGGPKIYSKTKPRRSQLTQSEFLGAMYDAEDSIADAAAAFEKDNDFEALASACDDAASDVRSAGEECQSKLDNMPEGLQQGDSGQLLERRVEAAETIADELESAGASIRDAEPDDPENAEQMEEAKQTVESEIEGISWDYE